MSGQVVNSSAAKPSLCDPMQIEQKRYWCAATAVALAAIGMVLLGLAAHLDPSGVLYASLGTIGSYSLSCGGGAVLVGVLALLAVQKKPVEVSAAVASRPTSSLQSVESDQDEGSETASLPGSMVVRPHVERRLVLDIDWSVGEGPRDEETAASTGKLVVHSGSSYGTVPSQAGGAEYRRGAHEALARREVTEEPEDRNHEAVLQAFMEAFKQQAQSLVETPIHAATEFEKELELDQLARLKEASRHIHRLRLDDSTGITRHSSGEHIVFEVAGLEGYIFKLSKEKPADQQEVEEYVRLRREARELCLSKNLFMIRIPACSYVEIDGKYFIVEERVEDLHGAYTFQQSLYEWGLSQPELQDYFRELFRQLTIFTCLFELGDVKYNNIPLDSRGNVVLIDLDQWGALEGLTRGFAESGGDGLLSYVPFDWFDETVRQAEELLHVSLEVDEVRERVRARAAHRSDYADHLDEKGITKTTTPVAYVPPEDDEEPNEAAEQIAQGFCAVINEHLAQAVSCDPVVGRRLEVDFHVTGSFWKGMKQEHGFKKFLSLRGNTGKGFINNIPHALEALKARGVIYDYEHAPRTTEAIIFA